MEQKRNSKQRDGRSGRCWCRQQSEQSSAVQTGRGNVISEHRVTQSSAVQTGRGNAISEHRVAQSSAVQ